MTKLSPRTLDIIDIFAAEARSRIQPENPTHAMMHQLISALQAERDSLTLTTEEAAGLTVDSSRMATLRDELMIFAGKYRAAWQLRHGLSEESDWMKSSQKTEAVFFADLFARVQSAEAETVNALMASSTNYPAETALAWYAEWQQLRNAAIATETAHAKLRRATQLRAGYAGILSYLGMTDLQIRLLSDRTLQS